MRFGDSTRVGVRGFPRRVPCFAGKAGFGQPPPRSQVALLRARDVVPTAAASASSAASTNATRKWLTICGHVTSEQVQRDVLKTVVLPGNFVPRRLQFRGQRDRQTMGRDQSNQKECYASDEWASKSFVNERDNHYSFPADRPFTWIRGRQEGGRSITWARQVYRWSDLDFTANVRDGIAIDWPIRYADIAPWYDHVERFIGMSGQREGLAHLRPARGPRAPS